MRHTVSLALLVVLVLSGCGGGNSAADNASAFRGGQVILNRLGVIPGAERRGHDVESLVDDDGAPGKIVRGATRYWHLHNAGSTHRVLTHYATVLRRLGYSQGQRTGDTSSHHQNWFRGDACVEVLTGNHRLLISAAARCSP